MRKQFIMTGGGLKPRDQNFRQHTAAHRNPQGLVRSIKNDFRAGQKEISATRFSRSGRFRAPFYMKIYTLQGRSFTAENGWEELALLHNPQPTEFSIKDADASCPPVIILQQRFAHYYGRRGLFEKSAGGWNYAAGWFGSNRKAQEQNNDFRLHFHYRQIQAKTAD